MPRKTDQTKGRQKKTAGKSARESENPEVPVEDAGLKRELDDLEEWLKYQCLANSSFDNSACKSIMYRPNDGESNYFRNYVRTLTRVPCSLGNLSRIRER